MYVFTPKDDITIECIFVSAILNLSHRGQQSLPIPQASKMASSVKIHVLWNIEVLQKFKKSFGCIYTETAFKDIQNV